MLHMASKAHESQANRIASKLVVPCTRLCLFMAEAGRKRIPAASKEQLQRNITRTAMFQDGLLVKGLFLLM